MSSVKSEEDGFEDSGVFVLDIEEGACAELEVMFASCADNLPSYLFEVDACVAQPESMEIGSDGEPAVADVLEDFLFVAVDGYLVFVPTNFDGGERCTFAGVATLTGDGVVLAIAFFVALFVYPYVFFNR